MAFSARIDCRRSTQRRRRTRATRRAQDSAAAAVTHRESSPRRSSAIRSASAMASFELDFWGRVRNLVRRSALAVSRDRRGGTGLSTLAYSRGGVDVSHFTRSDASGFELAEATVESRRDGLRIAKRRLDAGVTSALDFHQAETLLTQAETELAALRSRRRRATICWRRLSVGRSMGRYRRSCRWRSRRSRSARRRPAVGAAHHSSGHRRRGRTVARSPRKHRRRTCGVLPVDHADR